MSETKKINVVRLTAVHYQHLELEKANKFFDDFGLVEAQRDDSRIYYRGFGIDSYTYVPNKPRPRREPS